MSGRTALLIFLCHLGCNEGSRSRICEPATGSGCHDDEICAVWTDGTPDCFTPSSSALTEGASCERPNECEEGTGCVRLFGVARCVRFCDPDDEASCLTESSAAASVCIAALPDRPDIGLCVVPCEPGEGECPEGSTCGQPRDLGFAACVAEASETVGEGELCGPSAGCEAGALCVPWCGTEVCRAVEGATGCAEGTTAFAVPGMHDPLTGSDYRVCASCLPLGRFGEPGTWMFACAPGSSRCAEGELVSVAEVSIGAAVADASAFVFGASTPLWVGARRLNGSWLWPDSTPVPDDVWAAGEPTDEGDCALLDERGRLRAADCSEEAYGLCWLEQN